MQDAINMQNMPGMAHKGKSMPLANSPDRHLEIAKELSIRQARRGIDIIYAGPIGHLVKYQEQCIGAIREYIDVWYGAATSGMHITASTREEAIEKLVEAVGCENC